MRKLSKIILGITILLCTLSGCAGTREYRLSDGGSVVLNGKSIKYKTKQEDGKMISSDSENVKVRVDMENGGVFVIELYPQDAPVTVRNFLDLVDDGFYDGLTFHRIVAGFVAQGGDPQGTGMGGSGENIKGEFSSNGFSSNTLKHKRGTVSMARAMDKDSASSQFFICLDDADYLDGDYAAFGKVVLGMDTVDEMSDVATDENDKPLVPVVMKKLSIITDGEFEQLQQ